MTQLIEAKKGNITKEVKIIAKKEGVCENVLMENIAKGYVVIPKNKNRNNISLCGIGKGLKTKVNSNIGTSADNEDMDVEIKKAEVSKKYGADTIMDLSTGSKTLNSIRKLILEKIDLPLGTVPIYQAIVASFEKDGGVKNLTKDDMFRVIESQAKEGVDFMTIHSGVTLKTLDALNKQKRITDIVSRGGALLTQWMILNEKENPLYEDYDRVLEIAKKYDVTISLGDGFRPGSIMDATDRSQICELILLGELQAKSYDYGVQVMIEGPGHVPYNEIETNMILQKKLCNQAPFYVLGPLPTDIAMGYDHITCAIGGAAAASFGADFLCYVTPAEHITLPSIKDVEEGVVASKIAAHIGDISKGNKDSISRDREMSIKRKERNWNAQIKLAINPEKVIERRSANLSKEGDDVCTMCSNLCSMKIMDECLKEVGKVKKVLKV